MRFIEINFSAESGIFEQGSVIEGNSTEVCDATEYRSLSDKLTAKYSIGERCFSAKLAVLEANGGIEYSASKIGFSQEFAVLKVTSILKPGGASEYCCGSEDSVSEVCKPIENRCAEIDSTKEFGMLEVTRITKCYRLKVWPILELRPLKTHLAEMSIGEACYTANFRGTEVSLALESCMLEVDSPVEVTGREVSLSEKKRPVEKNPVRK